MKTSHKRLRKLGYWLLIDICIAVVLLALLLYKPGTYNPPKEVNDNEVSQYLTHELLADFYNGLHAGEPFDLVLEQKGVNDIISHLKWPLEQDQLLLKMPQAFFLPGSACAMSAVNIRGVEFIVTAVVSPEIDQEGMLHLKVDSVKVGAMNITPIAKIVAKKMLEQRIAVVGSVDDDNLRTKIAAALFGAEPFDPVLEIDGKKLRIESIDIRKEKAIIRFVPIESSR